jgi:AcrR family transcriptional regulator
MILEIAARLFGKSGFDKCSMQDISNATNVSKGTLYHYFKTKQEIYDAIFLNTLRRMTQYVGGSIDIRSDSRNQLIQYFRAHAEYFDTHYWDFNATMLGIAGVSSSAMRDEAVQLRDQYEAILRQIIMRGVESGEFHTREPNMTTRAALSLLNWMPRWYRPHGAMSAAAIAAYFAELLVDGLAPRQTRNLHPGMPNGARQAS